MVGMNLPHLSDHTAGARTTFVRALASSMKFPKLSSFLPTNQSMVEQRIEIGRNIGIDIEISYFRKVEWKLLQWSFGIDNITITLLLNWMVQVIRNKLGLSLPEINYTLINHILKDRFKRRLKTKTKWRIRICWIGSGNPNPAFLLLLSLQFKFYECLYTLDRLWRNLNCHFVFCRHVHWLTDSLYFPKNLN